MSALIWLLFPIGVYIAIEIARDLSELPKCKHLFGPHSDLCLRCGAERSWFKWF